MNSVIKGASYVLAHTPDMVLYNGTTQTTERIVNPDSEYLKEVPEHLRSYEDCVAYWPNQTYIGNVHPDELAQVEAPWYDKKMENASRYGKYGEIMPEEEFLFLVQISDQFEVVKLEKNFVEKYKGQFAANPIITEDISSQIEDGVELSEIEGYVNDEHAEGLYFNHELVGCVKRAHDIDQNLSAHVMHENLMSKATSVRLSQMISCARFFTSNQLVVEVEVLSACSSFTYPSDLGRPFLHRLRSRMEYTFCNDWVCSRRFDLCTSLQSSSPVFQDFKLVTDLYQE